jgi:ERCC4-type nuclease
VICQIDSREKERAIQKILAHFDKECVQYFVSKLPVGDYMSLDNARLCIDRKQNLSELCSNVCQQHDRFRSELERANKFGIKLVILCEHGGQIKSLEDVLSWKNPRLKESPLAVSGERLYRILSTMSKTYNVDFVFCDKRNTGKEIILILTEGSNVQ